MRPFLPIALLTLLSFSALAQQDPEHAVAKSQGHSGSFTKGTKILSFGFGFPNLYRISYETAAGYTHIKNTGFGPLYAKFEWALIDNLGVAPSFSYGTFHHSYYGWAYYPGGAEKVMYSDDVNVTSFGLSVNYHFADLLPNPRLDFYLGAGAAFNLLRYRYGNIPPYKEPELKTQLRPIGRAGLRFQFDPALSLFTEVGYDGYSVMQLGLGVRF